MHLVCPARGLIAARRKQALPHACRPKACMQRIRKRLPRRFRLGVPAASGGRFRLLPGCFRAGFVWGSGGCIIWLLIWFQGCFQNRCALSALYLQVCMFVFAALSSVVLCTFQLCVCSFAAAFSGVHFCQPGICYAEPFTLVLLCSGLL